jgi:hypothetical protein
VAVIPAGVTLTPAGNRPPGQPEPPDDGVFLPPPEPAPLENDTEIFAPPPAAAPPADAPVAAPGEAPAQFFVGGTPCDWLPLSANFKAVLDSLVNAAQQKHDRIIKVVRAMLSGANFYKSVWGISNWKELGWGGATNFLETLADPGRISEWVDASIREGPLRGGEERGKVHDLIIYRAWLNTVASLTADGGLGPGTTASFHVELTEQIRIIDQLISYVCPTGAPTAAEVTGLYLAGQTGEQQARLLHRLQNVPPDVSAAILKASRSRLDGYGEVRDWLRWRTAPDELDARLRQLGWTDAGERKQLRRSQDYLPPPSDLIRFAVKDVYLAGKLGRADMLKELEEQRGLRELMSAQGIGRFQIRTQEGIIESYDSVADYWLAHYRNISDGQAAEMLHRLRPNRVKRLAAPDGKGGMATPAPFTLTDYRALLKEEDVNPIFRDQLAAISYNRLSIRDLRRMYSAQVFGRPKGPSGFTEQPDGSYAPTSPAESELAESYQDAGYIREDAVRLARAAAVNWDDADKKGGKAKTAANACTLFHIGAVDEGQALSAMRDVGFSDRAARTELAACVTANRLKDVQASLKTVRRMFLRGDIDTAGARAMLLQIGIRPDAAPSHLARWGIEMLGQRKEISASQMCVFYQSGLMTLSQITERLLRLGFRQEDAARIVKHCELGANAKSLKERNKRAQADAKERERVAKLLAAQEKTRVTESDKLMSRLLAKRTDKNLIQWWQQGLISEAIIRETFRVRGVAHDDIDRWVKANLVMPTGKGAQGG